MKVKQILFVHSGGPQGLHEGSNDLVTYLRSRLGISYHVAYPIMPDPENPDYEQWKVQLKKEFNDLEDEIILVGHSLGGSVLLKYLSEETLKIPITGLYIVASPYWGKRDWKVGEFVLREDFVSRLPPMNGIFLYHSRNDNVVPFRHLSFYADKLPGAKVRAFNNYGHLFSEGLPELVQDIRGLDSH